jgi:hypothetical protein
MKKLVLSIIALAAMFGARADEGMWIPMLIGKNYDEMVRMGLKLSEEDLYSINNSSLKDAIMQFGGGCTAEMISSNGLLITNHHCGYGSITNLSSVENNYLDNGFWALSMTAELPAPGLSVTFLERVEDVTAEMRKGLKGLRGEAYNKKYEELRKQIEERNAEKGKYVANVKEYFNGNQYLLLIYKKFTDVRLVGTPPKSLGKYGGDTDNWMWPRHTADFSMFRVYAGADNQPAPYSVSNKPYSPKKFLPVSIKGVQEGDYAMIYGYPGRTNRYEVAAGLEVALNEVNPSIVNIREKKLAIMRKHMDQDKEVYLKYTSNYQSISNYWKYFIGQSEQLKRLKVVDKKKAEEKAFTKWARKYDENYEDLISEYTAAYADYRPYAKHSTYYSEAFKGPGLTKVAAGLEPLRKYLEKGERSKDSIDKYAASLKSTQRTFLKDGDMATDKELFAAMTQMYYTDVNKAQHPDIYQKVILKKYGDEGMEKGFAQYADYVYGNTMLTDSVAFQAFLVNPTLEKLNSDPAAVYANSFVQNYEKYYQPKIEEFNNEKKVLSRRYIKGLMEMKEGEMFYPDANSTMRISYGKVLSYSPQDAVQYNYYTTIDGLMAKYKPGDREFDLPAGLIELYNKKDYGQYVNSDGTIVTGFITNNDITGGNSGSPVINGKGELIGLAFDGNWEAMSGDIAFDKKYKRTIVVDARFVLFLIEKLGKAHNLIEEMEVHN